MRNEQSSQDVRHARTGKDGALFNGDGELMATVESFQAQSNWNNAQYTVLGNAMELETPNTFGVTLTFSQVVVESDKFITQLIEAMKNQTMPEWNFQGSLLGLADGENEPSEERVSYYRCVPSGTIDIQNIAVGDVIKRAWSLHCNQAPELTSSLEVER